METSIKIGLAESRVEIESDHAIILPIWVGSQFRPDIVLLIGGDTDLLLWVYISGEMRISVDSGMRNVRIGKVEWKAVTRNGWK